MYDFLYRDEEASLSSANSNSTNSSNLKIFQDLVNKRYDQDDNKTIKSVSTLTENTAKDQSIVNAVQEVAQLSKGRNTYESITQNDEVNTPIYDAYVNNTLGHYSEMPLSQQEEILKVMDDSETKLIKIDFEPFYHPEFINTCLSEKFPENNQEKETITSFLESVTYVDFLNNEKITRMIKFGNNQFPYLYPSELEWTDMKNTLAKKTFTFNNSPSVDTNNDSEQYKKFLDVLEGTLIKNINNYLNYLYKLAPLSFYEEIVISEEFGVGFGTFETYLLDKDIFPQSKNLTDFELPLPQPIAYSVFIDEICNSRYEDCKSQDEFFNMILTSCGFEESGNIREQIKNEFAKTNTSDLNMPYLSTYLQQNIQRQDQSITMPLSVYLLQIDNIVTKTQLKSIRIYVMVNKLKAWFKTLYIQRQVNINQ